MKKYWSKAVQLMATVAFSLAIVTPFGGFTKFFFYEPEMPEKLKNR